MSFNGMNLGLVVEEDGQPLIAFHPETIDLIAKTLQMKDGDLINVEAASDSDGEPIVTIKKLSGETDE